MNEKIEKELEAIRTVSATLAALDSNQAARRVLKYVENITTDYSYDDDDAL